MIYLGSTGTGARLLFGITSGLRKAWGVRQVRLEDDGGKQDRGFPWKKVALAGRARQSCSAALERAGTRSVVYGFW